MLLQFLVENFRSIKEKQVLNMMKSKSDELVLNNTFPLENSKTSLLRSAVIYGANAAGKSNIIKAMQTFQSIVLSSASSQLEDLIPVEPFLLDEEYSQAPTEFEVIFQADGIRYQYGFSATKKQVISEWLIAFPKGRPQRWFDREIDNEGNYVYEFGSYFTGNKSTWQKSTRPNALFLSTAIQLNNEQLKPIYSWFSTTLKISGYGGFTDSFSATVCLKDKNKKNKVLNFLKGADLNIHDLDITSEKFNVDDLPDSIPKSTRDDIANRFKDQEVYDVKTVHRTTENNLIKFDLENESDGTQKLFSFAGPWLDTLERGNVLFIDELHDSLHPIMVKYLVNLFHNPEINKKNAQLIFTTHETSILHQEVFRRDQVWFCRKNKQQSTLLYPLTDFKPRLGRENIELSYLSGRYNALPFINESLIAEYF